MVSNARLDFPEPDSPVITTNLLRGMVSEIFFRLCSRAPLIEITLSLINTLPSKADYQNSILMISRIPMFLRVLHVFICLR